MEHPNKVHSSRAAYLYLFSIPGHTSPIPTVTRHYGDTLPLCSSEATSSPESAKEQPGSPIPHIRPTSRYTAAQELQASLLATLCATLATLSNPYTRSPITMKLCAEVVSLCP